MADLMPYSSALTGAFGVSAEAAPARDGGGGQMNP
jgi:hypothetical protein